MNGEHFLAVEDTLRLYKNDGTLWLTGSNSYGQLGTNDTTSYSSPVQEITNKKWLTVIANAMGTAAIDDTGYAWRWGAYGISNLNNYASSPTQISTTFGQWKHFDGTFGVSVDGSLWAVGFNNIGIFGDSNYQVDIFYSDPVRIGSSNDWVYAFNTGYKFIRT